MPPSSFGVGSWPTLRAIELVRIRIPLVRPHVYAGGEERERDIVLIRAVDTDGAEGWGECSTLSTAGYTSETTDGAWRALRDELAPKWLTGRVPATAMPMAYAALEGAAVDLSLRGSDTSLVDAFSAGAAVRPSVEWCAVVGLRDDDRATLNEIADALAAGAAQIKLKIAPGRDVGPLAAVRDRYPDVPLAVDANGSYPSPSAVPSELKDFGLAYVEQPRAPDDLIGSAQAAADLGVPVALDESITSVARLVEAREVGAGTIVNVKVARLGGLAETAQVLAEMQREGMVGFVGGMLESAVGRAVALAVAAQPACTLPCDVGPTSRYFIEDIGSPFEPEETGRLSPPTGAGIGLVPDPDALERFAVDRVLLRA